MRGQFDFMGRKILIIFATWFVLFSFGCGKSGGNAPSNENPPPSGPPAAVVVTNPMTLSKISNTALTIAGTCESGATVYLTGSDTQNQTCVASSYNFTVTKTSDGVYGFTLYQTNTLGTSTSVSVTWTYDTSAPAKITLTSPLSNPYTSGDGTISVAGTCETGATVNMTGDHTAASTCVAGTFTITGITKGANGSYVFNLTQTDLATNVSQNLVFTWVRDTSIPATPTITNHVTNPIYTNTSPLTLAGACISGHTVFIAEGGAVLTSGLCAVSNTYSLNVAKGANGQYTLSVYQNDPVSGNDSASLDVIWVYDSAAPAAPVITTPAASPVTASGSITIAGTCELNATVNLGGDDVQSTICSSGSFNFSVSEAVDGTYNYTVTQTDLANNTSAADNQQWIRDSGALPLPTIDVPSADPYISNQTPISLSGTCQSGLTVTLSGVAPGDVTSPANSLTQTCVNASYTYIISAADGSYTLSVLQTNGITNSGSVTRSWTKDTVAPNTTITSSPAATNYSTTAEFTFTSSEANSTFECSLNSAPYTSCTTPLIYTDLANGAYTLNVRASDQANNVDASPATYSWTQDANNTIALWHFDSTSPLADSSNYSGGAKNDLTDNASANDATGKFAEARSMLTTANYVFVANTSSQQAISSFLTLEAQVQFNALPGNGGYAPIVSKINGGLASFEYGLRRQGGGKYFLYFRGSTNGTSFTEVRSTSLTGAEETAMTSAFNHLAVTWNLGTVKFFINGVAKGTATIGTVGTAKLAASNAQLRVGYNGTSSVNASVDEVRISQKVRWNGGFTPPASAYTAD